MNFKNSKQSTMAPKIDQEFELGSSTTHSTTTTTTEVANNDVVVPTQGTQRLNGGNGVVGHEINNNNIVKSKQIPNLPSKTQQLNDEDSRPKEIVWTNIGIFVFFAFRSSVRFLLGLHQSSQMGHMGICLSIFCDGRSRNHGWGAQTLGSSILQSTTTAQNLARLVSDDSAPELDLRMGPGSSRSSQAHRNRCWSTQC